MFSNIYRCVSGSKFSGQALKTVFFLAVIVLLLSGCQKPVEKEEAKVYDRPLPEGESALVKVTNPEDVPDFTIACSELDGLSEAIGYSLNYLSKPSSRQFFPVCGISHRRVEASLRMMEDMLESGLSGRRLNESLRTYFDVYMSVGCDDKGTVLFTGYYTPIFEGSLEEGGRYRYPLYKQPDGLVKGPAGEILGIRTAGGDIVKCPDREEIERSGVFAGQELVWLTDPFEVYIAHVQGSAIIKLPDGQRITVGYAANNGYEYRSISRRMVKEGVIPAERMSLSTMIDYFKRNPDEVVEYTSYNPRYVFFQETATEPRGSLNEPVTAMRSIATDKSIYPRASLAFLAAELPRVINEQVVTGRRTVFVLDQDTGGAIRAPGRCDVYMGKGPTAGRLAGRVYKEGKLYYLFVKEQYLKEIDQADVDGVSLAY
jgi:membrane-bound lytic murein transglycosylase A